jgi:5-methylcytosine-specific restriction endonuclease McrA
VTRRNKKPRISGDAKGANCAYCCRRMESTRSASRLAATRDHVQPKSLGGSYRIWCCRACNNIKADMTPNEWSLYMRQNPEWWKAPVRQTFADRLEAARQVPRI